MKNMYKAKNVIKLVGVKSVVDFIDAVLEENEYSNQYMKIQNFDAMDAYKENEAYKAFKLEQFVFYGEDDEFEEEFFEKYISGVESLSVKGSEDLAKLISALTRNQNTYELVVARGFTDYKDKFNIVKYYSVYVSSLKK